MGRGRGWAWSGAGARTLYGVCVRRQIYRNRWCNSCSMATLRKRVDYEYFPERRSQKLMIPQRMWCVLRRVFWRRHTRFATHDLSFLYLFQSAACPVPQEKLWGADARADWDLPVGVRAVRVAEVPVGAAVGYPAKTSRQASVSASRLSSAKRLRRRPSMCGMRMRRATSRPSAPKGRAKRTSSWSSVAVPLARR